MFRSDLFHGTTIPVWLPDTVDTEVIHLAALR
jgi:hypothetical protein